MSDAEKQQNATPKKPARWEKAFISALADTGIVSHACTAAKIERSTAYRHREQSKPFAVAWDEAVEIAADTLEMEALRRAHDGVEEPVYYKGVLVDTVRKYSDTLMIFLLKAAKPEKFRDRADLSLHGPNNGAIELEAKHIDYRTGLAALAPPETTE
jgi:hypothetical protein